MRLPVPSILACLLLSPLAFTGAGARAQEFPNKPIRIVVANTPGSVADTAARLLGPEMARTLGQPVVVENRPGAGGIVGLEYVAKRVPADGYTLVSTAVTAISALPATVKELRFDPLGDLPPISGLIELQYVFGSPAEAPWSDFAGFLKHARDNPGKLNYGAPGASVRLPMESLLHDARINVVHVAYTGGGPYMQAIVGNQVQLGLIPESAAKGFGAKFRPLAVTGAARMRSMPDVPTFREVGFPNMRGVAFSFNVPKDTPRPVVDTLHRAVSRALRDPEIKGKIEKMGFDVLDQSPAEAARALADETRMMVEVARRIGLEPQ